MSELNNIVDFPNQNNNQDEMDYKLYVLADLGYKHSFPGIGEESLYPDGWYSLTDYKKKSEILAEAIQNKKLINDTALYQELLQEIVPH